MPDNEEKLELLKKRIQMAPGREWINIYFDLVRDILKITSLHPDDPRLVLSLSPKTTSWFFPVTINFRYVASIRKKRINGQDRLYVGLIFNTYAKDIPQVRLAGDTNGWGQFRNLTGEYSEPPYFLKFENISELMYWLEASEQFYLAWSKSVLAEVNRAKFSTFRRFHEPLMIKMALDLDYRAATLDTVFPNSAPQPDSIAEEIAEPGIFFEGTQKTIVVNAYERNPMARSACIEHYGAICSVCNMTFRERYGNIAKDFIHVHHLKPLGEISAGYVVDPIQDLRPVCPNCHAMLHMRKPPYSINEMREILSSHRLGS